MAKLGSPSVGKVEEWMKKVMKKGERIERGRGRVRGTVTAFDYKAGDRTLDDRGGGLEAERRMKEANNCHC